MDMQRLAEWRASREAKDRRAALYRVQEAWDRAPATIRVMAGPYVVPMMAALDALAAELDALYAQSAPAAGHQHTHLSIGGHHGA